MREGNQQYVGGTVSTRAEDSRVSALNPLGQSSIELLEGAAHQVEETTNMLEALLGQIAGARNSATQKEDKSMPRSVPHLANALVDVPASIGNQCVRAAKLIEEIRQALNI